MSTDISGLMGEISTARYISLSGVRSGRSEIEDLADFVKRVRFEKELSQRDVETRSRGTISKGYIGQIENRSVLGHSVTPQKLSALATGLGVSEDEVFAVARGKSLNKDEAVDAEMAHFASRVKKLTPQQRRDFEIAWRMANDLLDRLERDQAGQK